MRQRVLVSLLNDRAIAGVLLRTTGEWLVLADAQLHEASLKPQPMDGEIYIDRDRIAFIQVAAPKVG
jgi:hypothetical protein